MRDTLLGHQPPRIKVMVRVACGPIEYSGRVWTIEQGCARLAQAAGDGYADAWLEGPDGRRILPSVSDDVIDGPDCVGTPPEDEPGGYAIRRPSRTAFGGRRS